MAYNNSYRVFQKLSRAKEQDDGLVNYKHNYQDHTLIPSLFRRVGY